MRKKSLTGRVVRRNCEAKLGHNWRVALRETAVVAKPVAFAATVGQIDVVELLEERRVAVLAKEFDFRRSCVGRAPLAAAHLRKRLLGERNLVRLGERVEDKASRHRAVRLAAVRKRKRNALCIDFESLPAVVGSAARSRGAVQVNVGTETFVGKRVRIRSGIASAFALCLCLLKLILLLIESLFV